MDLQAFVTGEVGKCRYVLAHLALSFLSREDDPRLRAASVHTSLKDTATPSDVLAWSVLPLRASSPYEEKAGFSLGPSLKFHGAEISLGSIDKEVTRHPQEIFLEATGEMTAEVAWTFTQTRTHDLTGSCRLAMVIRAPAEREGSMSVVLQASVEQRGFSRLYRSRVALPPAPGEPGRDFPF